MYRLLKNIYMLFFLLIKIVLLIITIILLPLYYLVRINRKKLRYFSMIDFNYIKNRPQIISKYLSKNGYDVTYSLVKNINDKTNSAITKINPGKIKIKNYYFDDKHKVSNKLILLFKSFLLNYNVIIFSEPTQLKYVDLLLIKVKGTKIIYDCMDYYKYWHNKKYHNFYIKYESTIVNKANCIITSSDSLKEYIISDYNVNPSKIHVVRNGYSFDSIKYKKINLKHPNAIYIGTIDDYFDFKVVKDYAIKYPNFYFYLIGPVIPNVKNILKKLPKNVIIYGVINHNEIPSIIKSSDTMIIPFIVNELIKYVDPIKLYEYLYFKKPIVSSYWKELDQFNNYVNYYKDSNSFEQLLNKSLKIKNINNKSLNNFLKNSTWDKRGREYLNIISK